MLYADSEATVDIGMARLSLAIKESTYNEMHLSSNAQEYQD